MFKAELVREEELTETSETGAPGQSGITKKNPDTDIDEFHSLAGQAKHVQVSQPLFIRGMFQSPKHLCCPLLDLLQEFHISLVLRSPELNTALQT
ncbi:hypothetical protein DUI87_16517 [Hirundo rustica rustica]|uniref:Uncharacterized protein n=1 Tax=Hirundo rustica rustica TaxID=333673 RepID=A0A3M0K1M8_HIRRU|nr:hypothetical protein DUI87_16517 [Hirundo rustica rustica]